MALGTALPAMQQDAAAKLAAMLDYVRQVLDL